MLIIRTVGKDGAVFIIFSVKLLNRCRLIHSGFGWLGLLMIQCRLFARFVLYFHLDCLKEYVEVMEQALLLLYSIILRSSKGCFHYYLIIAVIHLDISLSAKLRIWLLLLFKKKFIWDFNFINSWKFLYPTIQIIFLLKTMKEAKVTKVILKVDLIN